MEFRDAVLCWGKDYSDFKICKDDEAQLLDPEVWSRKTRLEDAHYLTSYHEDTDVCYYLLSQYHTATVRHGLDPQKVHKELLKVDEFWNGHCSAEDVDPEAEDESNVA
jgi:hypothetical protein